MMSENKTIVTDLKNRLIQNFGSSVKDVVLFGSRAKGNFSPDSDFDVLVVLNTDYTGKEENKILDICYEVDLKFGILLDVHIISSNELNSPRGKQPIFVNAIKSGLYA
jgi:uncharacterized protein